jgi:hypothetical protein
LTRSPLFSAIASDTLFVFVQQIQQQLLIRLCGAQIRLFD